MSSCVFPLRSYDVRVRPFAFLGCVFTNTSVCVRIFFNQLEHDLEAGALQGGAEDSAVVSRVLEIELKPMQETMLRVAPVMQLAGREARDRARLLPSIMKVGTHCVAYILFTPDTCLCTAHIVSPIFRIRGHRRTSAEGLPFQNRH